MNQSVISKTMDENELRAKLNEYKEKLLNKPGIRQLLSSHPTDLEILLRIPRKYYPFLIQALSLPEIKKDINTPDPATYGFTPLLKALNMDKDLVIALLEQGANPLVRVGRNDIVDFLRISPLPAADKEVMQRAIMGNIQARLAQLRSEKKSVEEISEAKGLSNEIEDKLKSFIGGENRRKSRRRKTKRRYTRRR